MCALCGILLSLSLSLLLLSSNFILCLYVTAIECCSFAACLPRCLPSLIGSAVHCVEYFLYIFIFKSTVDKHTTKQWSSEIRNKSLSENVCVRAPMPSRYIGHNGIADWCRGAVHAPISCTNIVQYCFQERTLFQPSAAHISMQS